MIFSLSPFAPENLASRDGLGSPVPRQPVPLRTQAESGAYLHTGFLSTSAAGSIYLFKPPYAIGSVPSLSGHAIAYRWRSLPRVRRHRASKPQGSSKRVLPWQVTMDQLLCASLSHTHYWYQGMFGVLGSRCLTGSALLDCHVLKGFGVYMIGILDSYLMCGRLVSPACGSLVM